MKTILERIKSPVIILQLVTIFGTAVVLLAPELDGTVKTVVGIISAIINAFAGFNNPTNLTGI